MPKGHRPAKSHGGYYRSPVLTAETTQQYAPLSSRPNLVNLSNNYYAPGTLTMSQQQAYNQPPSGYPNGVGGPVQHPMSHQHAQQQQQYSQMTQQPPPQTSIRPSSGAWNPQDDQTLMVARAQGMNWQPIQQAYFPTKTPNACRKRHERLMERRSADDWDGIKLEKMAQRYMAMRKELWAPLAAECGEKWNVVEQKCMSQGLKNLQTSARSCARRERMLDTASTSQSGAAPYSVNVQNAGAFEHHTDDSGYADELEAEYDADGASDRSGGSVYQDHSQHISGHSGHSGHGYSQSGGSAGSMGMMGGGMDLRHMDAASMRYAQHQSRLPSMDMGIGAIINRPVGDR